MTRLRYLAFAAALIATSLLPKTMAQDDPESILTWFAEHQRDISVALYPLDDLESGLFHNPDLKRPLASTVKILVLAEYARRVAEEELDPEELVPLDSVELFYYRETDGGAHEAAMAALREAGRLENDSLSLHEVAHAMIRFSDNAAADYLILRFGREAMEEIVELLELEHSEPPAPLSGIFLGWSLPHVLGEDAGLSAEQRTDRAWNLGRRIRNANKFPDEIREWMESLTTRMSYAEQAASALSFPAGTTREYAGIMARMYRGELLSEEVSRIMLDFLDWPMDQPGTAEQFETLATKGGALAGILTSAYVIDARPGADGADPPPYVMALFMEELPADVFGRWMTTFAHQAFEFRLLTDPAFRAMAAETLGK